MEALNRYRKCLFVYERNFLRFVGHDIFCENFKPGFHAYVMYSLVGVFMFSNIYTMIAYDSFMLLNALMFMFVAVEIVTKIYSVKYSVDLLWMINKLNDIYKVNVTSKDKKRISYFITFSHYTEIVFKCGTFLYFLSILSYFLNPMYMYLFEHEIVTLLPTYFPGIDEKSVNGYIIFLCYHLTLLILAFVASSASDFLFTMLIVNTPIMAILIELEVDQLNRILKQKPTDMAMIKFKLRNILLMHREFTEFQRTMDRSFFKICFAQIFSAAGGACVALFIDIMFEGFYLPANSLLFAFLFQIASFCALGTIVELANDHIYRSIITCHWYLLRLREQRMFRYLLQNCQKPRILSVGGFAYLNMVTCLNVFKTIYSFTMLVYTFVNQ